MPARKPATVLSAQVILRSARGTRPDAADLTADRIAQHTPAEADARAAAAAFAGLGFEVGSMVGNSFAITAPAATFEKVFGSKLGAKAELSNRTLATSALPASVRSLIEAVTFGRAPEFGPKQFR